MIKMAQVYLVLLLGRVRVQVGATCAGHIVEKIRSPIELERTTRSICVWLPSGVCRVLSDNTEVRCHRMSERAQRAPWVQRLLGLQARRHLSAYACMAIQVRHALNASLENTRIHLGQNFALSASRTRQRWLVAPQDRTARVMLGSKEHQTDLLVRRVRLESTRTRKAILVVRIALEIPHLALPVTLMTHACARQDLLVRLATARRVRLVPTKTFQARRLVLCAPNILPPLAQAVWLFLIANAKLGMFVMELLVRFAGPAHT
jgi:hypothetical protein